MTPVVYVAMFFCIAGPDRPPCAVSSISDETPRSYADCGDVIRRGEGRQADMAGVCVRQPQ